MVLRTNGGRAFLRFVLQDLAAGRSVLVTVPRGINVEMVRQAVLFELSKRDYRTLEVQVGGVPPFSSVADALLPFHRKPPRSSDISSLLLAEGLPDVLCFLGFDAAPAEEKKDCLSFVSRWAGRCQVAADQGGKSLPVVIVADAVGLTTSLPDESVYFSIRPIWGVSSALENRLACRAASDNGDFSPAARWREHVIPAVSGFDMSVMETLWDCVTDGSSSILKGLLSYAEDVGWTPELLSSAGIEDFLRFNTKMVHSIPSSLPEKFLGLWACGVIGWTPEYGVEVHSSALVVMARNEDVAHRIWRGQADILLPMLDQVRLSVCERFTKTYGSEWPVRWSKPQSDEEYRAVTESPLACQMGHLQWLIGSVPALSHEQRTSSLISLSRWMRNEMAHYRPIGFRDFEGFLREISRM